MELKNIIYPSPLKAIKNFFSTALIRGYYDQEFNRDEFLNGATQVKFNFIHGIL